jgi:hypothetical protein
MLRGVCFLPRRSAPPSPADHVPRYRGALTPQSVPASVRPRPSRCERKISGLTWLLSAELNNTPAARYICLRSFLGAMSVTQTSLKENKNESNVSILLRKMRFDSCCGMV